MEGIAKITFIPAGWKIATILLLFYTFVGGLFFDVPRLNILEESIRNLHFHVPLWFGMLALFSYSTYQSFRVLNGKSNTLDADKKAMAAVEVGIVYGV